MNSCFTPDEDDRDLIIDWRLFVAQFDEGNESRTRAELALLKAIGEYVKSILQNVMKGQRKDCEVMKDNDGDGEGTVIDNCNKKNVADDNMKE